MQEHPENTDPVAPQAVTEPVATASEAQPAGAPAGVAFPKTIKSFVRRAGRTTTGQAKAFELLGPRFVLPYRAAPLDMTEAFGAPGPAVLALGFGVGALLKRIAEQSLSNIRILQHDAVEVIDHMLPHGVLEGVHIFFPDPWHKTKHNKRRLIQAPLVAKLAARLRPGGYLHCATDWEPYAEQMLEVLGAEPLLRNRQATGGYADRPAYRPETKFERRGLRLGHGVWDLVFEKIQ